MAYSNEQIIDFLRQAESATSIEDHCLHYGISPTSFYQWRAKYAGMDSTEMLKAKEKEHQERQNKKMQNEELLIAEIIQQATKSKRQILNETYSQQK